MIVVLLAGDEKTAKNIMLLCDFSIEVNGIHVAYKNDAILLYVKQHNIEVFIQKYISAFTLMTLTPGNLCKHLWNITSENSLITVSNESILDQLTASKIVSKQSYGDYDIYNTGQGTSLSTITFTEIFELLDMAQEAQDERMIIIESLYKNNKNILYIINPSGKKISRKDILYVTSPWNDMSYSVGVSLIFDKEMNAVTECNEKIMSICVSLEKDIHFSPSSGYTLSFVGKKKNAVLPKEVIFISSTSALRSMACAELCRLNGFYSFGNAINKDKKFDDVIEAFINLDVKEKKGQFVCSDESELIERMKVQREKEDMKNKISLLRQMKNSFESPVTHIFNIAGKNICGSTLPKGQVDKSVNVSVIREESEISVSNILSLQSVGKDVERIYAKQPFALALENNFEFKVGDLLLFWMEEK